MTPTGKPRFYMFNIKELREMLAFAEANYKETNDDRVIVVSQHTGILDTHYVATCDDFFKEAVRPKTTFDEQAEVTNFEQLTCLTEVTDWDSA